MSRSIKTNKRYLACMRSPMELMAEHMLKGASAVGAVYLIASAMGLI